MADMIPKNHILRLINKYVDFSFIGNKEARRAIQGVANLSNYAIKWFRFIIYLSKTILSAPGKPADNILLLLAHEQVWEKMTFSTSYLGIKIAVISNRGWLREIAEG